MVINKEFGKKFEKPLQDICFYNSDNDLVLTVGFELDKEAELAGEHRLVEKGQIHHYKYCADINSFISVIETVVVMIEDELKKKDK